MINYSELIEQLPQKPPFRFVDKVLDHTENSLCAQLDLTGKEEFFKGHFDKYPVMPGVLLLEAMFQTGALFNLCSTETPSSQKLGKVGVVVRVDKVKFKNLIRPPQTLMIKVTLLEKIEEETMNASTFSGNIYSLDNETGEQVLAASAQFRTTLAEIQEK